MAQWIVTDFDRPAKELVAEFRDIPSSILSDCMNRFQAMSGAVKSLKPGTKVCGPAFTVQSVEACNWGAHQALALAKPDDVLVIAARGSTMGAVWGHVMTYAARKRGLAGVVIDGFIRDVEENRADSLPIFCRGSCPAGPHKGWPGNINVPISCAGVPVLPGDIVVGDDDGVVVVPQSRAESLLAEARKRGAMEDDWYRRMEKGETTISLLGIKSVGE